MSVGKLEVANSTEVLDCNTRLESAALTRIFKISEEKLNPKFVSSQFKHIFSVKFTCLLLPKMNGISLIGYR